MTSEEILEMADAAFSDRLNNKLPTLVFMAVDDELLTFARLIESKTREADANICEAQAKEPECPERAKYCAEAIRSQK